MDWKQIEGSGKLYTDHSFPADQTMISWKAYPRTVGGLTKYLTWFKDFRRPRDLVHVAAAKGKGVVPTVKLFGHDYEKTGELNSRSFEQGAVGDNYFLTVLAGLSEVKGYIPSLFEQKQYPTEGIFAVSVNVKGRREYVTVDDLFPTYGNRVAFAKPTSDDGWWVPILEKVYAKVNVNYESISSGSQAEAARFLTGAPVRELELNRMNSAEVWTHLTIGI